MASFLRARQATRVDQWQNDYAKELEFRIEDDEEKAVEKLQKARDKALAEQASEISAHNPNRWLGEKSYDLKDVTPLKTGKMVPLVCEASNELKKTYVVSCIGTRDTQEDTHIATTFDALLGGIKTAVEITAVFDGHSSSSQCSEYCAKNVVAKLKEKLELFNKTAITKAGMRNALKHACVQLNYDFMEKGGTCANIALKIDNTLWIANLGDSRAILVNKATGKTEQLSKDQKASDPDLEKGILKRGLKFAVEISDGYIRYRQYNLAVARAIGNRQVPPFLSARCKVTERILNPGEKSILIQTCDGVPDVMTTNHTGYFFHQRNLQYRESLEKTTVSLVAAALATFGSDDNVTAIARSIRYKVKAS
jgi:serine/threonine protein phosphatase PrpC